MDEQLTRVREQWIASLDDESVERFVQCVTPEAVWLPPRGKAVEGREAIAQWLEPLFNEFSYDFKVSNVRVRSLGDWVVEEADFETVLRAKESVREPLVHHGRYLLIWRRVSNEWLIERYVDRTDASSEISSGRTGR